MFGIEKDFDSFFGRTLLDKNPMKTCFKTLYDKTYTHFRSESLTINSTGLGDNAYSISVNNEQSSRYTYISNITLYLEFINTANFTFDNWIQLIKNITFSIDGTQILNLDTAKLSRAIKLNPELYSMIIDSFNENHRLVTLPLQYLIMDDKKLCSRPFNINIQFNNNIKNVSMSFYGYMCTNQEH